MSVPDQPVPNQHDKENMHPSLLSPVVVLAVEVALVVVLVALVVVVVVLVVVVAVVARQVVGVVVVALRVVVEVGVVSNLLPRQIPSDKARRTQCSWWTHRCTPLSAS